MNTFTWMYLSLYFTCSINNYHITSYSNLRCTHCNVSEAKLIVYVDVCQLFTMYYYMLPSYNAVKYTFFIAIILAPRRVIGRKGLVAWWLIYATNFSASDNAIAVMMISIIYIYFHQYICTMRFLISVNMSGCDCPCTVWTIHWHNDWHSHLND